jgi:hypothetical protein
MYVLFESRFIPIFWLDGMRVLIFSSHPPNTSKGRFSPTLQGSEYGVILLFFGGVHLWLSGQEIREGWFVLVLHTKELKSE